MARYEANVPASNQWPLNRYPKRPRSSTRGKTSNSIDVSFPGRMNDRIQIVSIVGSLLIMGFVFELVRRRRLRVEYSILWLVAGVGMLALSVFRDALDALASAAGVAYAPAALFLAALVFGILLSIHLTTVITKLADQNVRLAQRIALLEARIDGAAGPAAAAAGGGGGGGEVDSGRSVS